MSKSSSKSKLPFAVGLTGGIGAGKSTVAAIFAALDVPVFYADLEARKLMDESAELQAEIIQLLGRESVRNGVLNRPFIAQQVFNDANLLAQLNALIHPKVRDAFDQFRLEHSGAKYVIQEAAILFETGGYKLMDFNILVTAPIELRLNRVILRDGASEAEIRKRMDSQWTEERKVALADGVIVNDGVKALLPQVLRLDEKLKGLL